MAKATEDERLTLMGLMAEAHNGLITHLQPDIERFDLNVSEFETLMRLVRTPGHQLRMTDLAAQVGMSTSGLTRLVDRLVNAGLIERTACPADRRGSYATLTPAGDKKISAALEPHLELLDRWLLAPLDDRDVAALSTALRKVRDHVRPESVAGVGGACDEAAMA